ncbi:MAG TPA: AAA-like domain-containing protein, partial [Candidatus Saccharimonadales bacterium]|nr:AAA-like domain-containing protein [Candidatus Saccharimonadales bacterium]
ASASYDQTVKLWEAGSGQLLRTLNGHSSFVYSVAWSPDGKALASASDDQTVKLWEAGSGQLLRTLSGHSSLVTSVAWTPDGKALASASYDSTLVIWSAATGEVQTTSFLLPGNEWLTTKPGYWPYASSFQGDDYAAVRFGNRLRPIYPLNYYRQELKRDLNKPWAKPQHQIKPKPLRLAWEQWHNKPLWLGGFALVYCTGLGATLVLARRADPAQIARQFFSRAGFDKVESLGHRRLQLAPKAGQPPAEVIICDSDYQSLSLAERDVREVRTYFVYKGQFPPHEAMQAVRARTRQEVIPLQTATLARAVSDNNCEHKLRELQEPFVARTDPYDESRPISDPVWFYGREDLLARVPAALRQHQHAGIFGLRKVGKTSLLNQLRSQLASSCSVWIDCQGYPPAAGHLLQAILKEFRAELTIQGVKNLSPLAPAEASPDFRESFLHLYDTWVQSGKQGPFILLLDEVDKLFPDRRMRNSEEVLGEWMSLFRLLRALAQEKKCLAVLVTAYRPDVNRQNLLSPAIGENPMFMSFQEYFLGPLHQSDTEKMVREIGAWKDIHWSPGALKRIYELCGGHPLVTRLFASDACLQGDRKQVEEATVVETAQAVRAGFHKHRIGRYYQESIWTLLQEDEQAALRIIAGNGGQSPPRELEDAITNLEQFGVVRNEGGRYQVNAGLFQSWLERSQTAWPT